MGKKILIDQLLYAPAFTCILYAYLQAANGDIAGIPEVLQDKVVPTLMANYAVWPLAHALNFYYVPTEQRILYNNFIAVRARASHSYPCLTCRVVAPVLRSEAALRVHQRCVALVCHASVSCVSGVIGPGARASKPLTGCRRVQVCWTTWLSCLAH